MPTPIPSGRVPGLRRPLNRRIAQRRFRPLPESGLRGLETDAARPPDAHQRLAAAGRSKQGRVVEDVACRGSCGVEDGASV